jgi:transposase
MAKASKKSHKHKRNKKRKITILHPAKVEQPLILPFALLLANKFLKLIGFVEFIDGSVEWDESHWKVSPGNLAKAVILATFMQVRAPLYRIKRAFAGYDTEALFGKGVMPEHLNDYSIARALDRISEAKPEGLFSSICLSMYSVFHIAFNRLHSDTTTLSFYGQYMCDDAPEGALNITKGYNKDHLPHCKQAVVGKIVNEHGIAVASSTMDGNTSDIEWNQKALALTKQIFGDCLNEVTYIADSKLINLPTFKQLTDPDNRIRFISRCPANFYGKVAGRLIEKAYKFDQWTDIGQIGSGKNACTYEMQEFMEAVENCDTRFIVVRSSAGKDRFEHKLEKQRMELKKDILTLSGKVFVCEADAREEWARFEKAHKKSLFLFDVCFKEEKTEKRPRGNPGKNPKPPVIVTSWRVTVHIQGENATAVEKLKHEEECFVMITSIHETEFDGKEILRQYKEQTVVEAQFRLLKEPALAASIFLKTPERINALVMLMNISLLIRAIVQYKIRKSINESEEELPRIGWNNKKLENPTIKYVLEALEKAYFVKEQEDTYSYGFYSEHQQLTVTTVLELLDIDIEEFLE